VAKEMSLALRNIFVHTSNESLTCRKILRHGTDGFSSPPKEGVLRVFVALKNPLSSEGFGPANTGSNGKHAIHYTTEDDTVAPYLCIIFVTNNRPNGGRSSETV
jgi:hypothetical protein